MNENFISDINAVDVVEKGWKDIIWQEEVDIRNLAIDYLKRPDNRNLWVSEFNILANKVREYLTHVDQDKSDLSKKFEELKMSVISETRNNINNSSNLDVANVDLRNIKSLAWLSHYLDKSADVSIKMLEKEIWVDNLWKILFLTTAYTTLELWKWLSDTLKLWEWTAEWMEALDNNELSELQKCIELLKWTWMDVLRAIAIVPWLKQVLSSIKVILSKLKIPNSFYRLAYENRGSIILREWVKDIMEAWSAYKKYPFLSKHKEFLWENLSINDVVWEWTQALIIKHPTESKLVVKVAKEWKVDDLTQEFNNHEIMFRIINEWNDKWLISQKIKVPMITKWEDAWYFIMEKVEWQSLYSKALIDYFWRWLPEEEILKMWNLTDNQLREYLKLNHKADDSFINMIIEDYSWDKLADLLWTSNKYRSAHWKIWWTELSTALDYIKKNWIMHNDLHPWNIMLDKNWNIYIIDFWRIKLLNNQ